MAAQNLVVDFFLIDESFPSGHVSLGSARLEKELQEKYPKGYVQSHRGERVIREQLAQRFSDATVSEIVSLSRHEVTVGGYWMRYYRLCFVPVSGHWIV